MFVGESNFHYIALAGDHGNNVMQHFKGTYNWCECGHPTPPMSDHLGTSIRQRSSKMVKTSRFAISLIGLPSSKLKVLEDYDRFSIRDPAF
eukprot:2580188-Amphidinium_carterae.1